MMQSVIGFNGDSNDSEDMDVAPIAIGSQFNSAPPTVPLNRAMEFGPPPRANFIPATAADSAKFGSSISVLKPGTDTNELREMRLRVLRRAKSTGIDLAKLLNSKGDVVAVKQLQKLDIAGLKVVEDFLEMESSTSSMDTATFIAKKYLEDWLSAALSSEQSERLRKSKILNRIIPLIYNHTAGLLPETLQSVLVFFALLATGYDGGNVKRRTEVVVPETESKRSKQMEEDEDKMDISNTSQAEEVNDLDSSEEELTGEQQAKLLADFAEAKAALGSRLARTSAEEDEHGVA